MRQVGAFIVCIFILSIANPGYVISEVHGFSIGFSEGVEFHYTVLQGPIDDYYIVVNEVGPIPENLTSVNQVSLNITGYWSNGTEFPEMYDLGIFWAWVPIGNWTYLKTLFGYSDPETVNWIDTEEFFGVNNSVEGYPSYVSYLKADGVLFELHHILGGTTEIHYIRTDGSTTTTTTPGTTTTTPGTTSTQTTSTEPTDGTTGPSLFDTPEIILVSIGGVLVILVVVVIFAKKR